MGIFNVIKLANDYNKAKKVLKDNKANINKIKDAIERVQKFIKELDSMRAELTNFICKVKDVARKLNVKLKKGDK